jgi:crotonobetainyl-CoA:carnitine CoA-transferase CaiB-like acyl-CoA transferase
MKFNKTQGDVCIRPAPALGEHTEEVLREIGYSAEKIAELRKQSVLLGSN